MKVVNIRCGVTPTKGTIIIDNSFIIMLVNNRNLYFLVRTFGRFTTSKS